MTLAEQKTIQTQQSIRREFAKGNLPLHKAMQSFEAAGPNKKAMPQRAKPVSPKNNSKRRMVAQEKRNLIMRVIKEHGPMRPLDICTASELGEGSVRAALIVLKKRGILDVIRRDGNFSIWGFVEAN